MRLAETNLNSSGEELTRIADAIAARLGNASASGAEARDDEGMLRRALLYAAQIERRLASTENDLARLRSLSVTDELTGLLNRRGLVAEGSRLCAAASRYGWRGAVLYADLDGFKAVNDRFGHAAGDALLRRVARLLGDSVRACDVVGRLGGDEFAVVLSRTSSAAACERALVLKRQIETSAVEWEGRAIQPRASVGVAPFRPGDTIEDALRRADAAMYAVKRDRRVADAAA